jgi:hypothetical protein
MGWVALNSSKLLNHPKFFHFPAAEAADPHFQFDLPAWTARHYLGDYHLI